MVAVMLSSFFFMFLFMFLFMLVFMFLFVILFMAPKRNRLNTSGCYYQ